MARRNEAECVTECIPSARLTPHFVQLWKRSRRMIWAQAGDCFGQQNPDMLILGPGLVDHPTLWREEF